MKKTAIVYDFDKTLCTKDMQEYSLIPTLGYDDPGLFWKRVSEIRRSGNMDSISAYLYLLQKEFAAQNMPLRREMFKDIGNTIVWYEGVEDWFERINTYGREKGLEIEHYIISSGMAEIIENTSIARHFRKIYACRYLYDEKGEAVWPAHIINYTTKTQYIFRINKQVLDEGDDDSLNEYVPMDRRPVPFERMIYIADGMTDVPCMRTVRSYGGKSIAVYNREIERAREVAMRLIHDHRADFIAEADYREGSFMDRLVRRIIDQMAAAVLLEEMEGSRENG
ncbi:MAG: haloacid dehalogenase-like hydrolase [Solobacterium sp.]|nr:haloacid dehalogenase-like hydrolase [Solobacterium sp.]